MGRKGLLVLVMAMVLCFMVPESSVFAACRKVEVMEEITFPNPEMDPVSGFNGYFNTKGEYGLFTFTAPVSGTYEIMSVGHNNNPQAVLYTIDGEKITYDNDSNGNLNFYMRVELTEGERYLLKVSAYKAKYTGFYCGVIVCPSGYIIDDGGNSISNPTEIGFSADLPSQGFMVENQFCGDVDYFSFKAPVSGEYHFSSSCNAYSECDPEIYIYSGTGKNAELIAYNCDGNVVNFDLTTFLIKGKTYTIRVESFMVPGSIPMLIDIKTAN